MEEAGEVEMKDVAEFDGKGEKLDKEARNGKDDADMVMDEFE